MKKINLKTVVIVVVMLVVIVFGVVAVTQAKIFISGATSDVEPTNVVAVPSEDGKTAVITWTSEKESVAKVEYGTTAASLVLMTADGALTKNHSLTLNQLRPMTNYYYRIRIEDEIFDNGGMPYMFKTKGESDPMVLKPTIVISPPTTATTTSVTPTNKPVTTTTPASPNTATVCDKKTDYNKDGTVNSMDMATCTKNGGAMPTSTAKVKVDCSKNTKDYNSDGVVNSIDRIKCLQSQ